MRKSLCKMISLCLASVMIMSPLKQTVVVANAATVFNTQNDTINMNDYSLVNEQKLGNGLIYREYILCNTGIATRASSVSYKKVFELKDNGKIVFQLLQETYWAYGGEAGKTPYLGNAYNKILIQSPDLSLSDINTYTNHNEASGTTTYHYQAYVKYKNTSKYEVFSTTCTSKGECS